MKINKFEKLVCSLYYNGLDHGLILHKVHRFIEFNQEAWLKPYRDIYMEIRTKAKNDFEKFFFTDDEQFTFWNNCGEFKVA